MLKSVFAGDPAKHYDYYRQYAIPSVKAAIKSKLSTELADSPYPYDCIPLERWQGLASLVPDVLFRLCGDKPSLENKVCALRVAAKLVMEGE